MAEDNFMDGNHALLTGEILGALWNSGLDANPVIDEDGDYTYTIIVKRPSGNWRLTIAPDYQKES